MSEKNNGNKVLEDAAKKLGGKLAQKAAEDVVEGAVVKSAAKAAAKSILKIGLFGKIIIAVVCVAIIVGVGYYVYSQIANRSGNTSDGGNAGISTIISSPEPTVSNNPPSSNPPSETPTPDGEGGELNGHTFLDETGSVSLTFTLDKVVVEFPYDDYSVMGTYEAEGGFLTLHLDEFTFFTEEPSPYTIKDDELILGGDVFIRQK